MGAILMKQPLQGTPCYVWEKGDIQKQLWYYLEHVINLNRHVPVFVDKWPPIKDEYTSYSLHNLEYEEIIRNG